MRQDKQHLLNYLKKIASIFPKMSTPFGKLANTIDINWWSDVNKTFNGIPDLSYDFKEKMSLSIVS